MPHIRLSSEAEVFKVAQSFREVHVFLGYGERAQYADVEEVLTALGTHLKAIQLRCEGSPFLAVYGGDKAVLERPDLGWLMFRMQELYNCKLMAIQSAGDPDTHTEYCFVAEQQFETVTRTNASGVEEQAQQVLYGGTRGGKPVGGARYYLGPEFTQGVVEGQRRLLKSVVVMGGGGVALEEVQYADLQGVPWVYVPSRARNEEAYKSRYGPVHDWVRRRMDEGGDQGKAYLMVSGNMDAWEVPRGNLLQIYLEACERHGAVAITGVASQLLRRARMIQPVPYHRILGQDRGQLMGITLLHHMDPSGSGEVAAAWAELALTLLNPRMPWRQALELGAPEVASGYVQSEAAAEHMREVDVLTYAKQRHALGPMPASAFLSAAEVSCRDLSDTDVAQAVLEVLAVPGSGVSASDPRVLFQVLFNHLDVSGEGYITSEEFRLVALNLHPAGRGSLDDLIIQSVRESLGAAQSSRQETAADPVGSILPGIVISPDGTIAASSTADPNPTSGEMDESAMASDLHPEVMSSVSPAAYSPQEPSLPSGLSLLLGLFQRKDHEHVTEDEFIVCTLEGLLPLSGLPLHKVESIVLELMSRRIRPKYRYDFSRVYLGVKGLPPLIEALHHDPSFEYLGLRGTGVSDRNCIEIVELLKNHPSVSSLDLSHNPIGDRGGVEIARLLSLNPRLVRLDIQGTHLTRKSSRVHHDKLGPSDCEDGLPIFQALQYNQSLVVRKPEELVQLLRNGGSHELRAVFAAHEDHATGRIPLSLLLRELRSMAQACGFPVGTADKVLHSERLLGAGAKAEGEDGDLHITFTEFMLFLDTDEPVTRVMFVIKHNRAEVKKAFFRLVDINLALSPAHYHSSSNQLRVVEADGGKADDAIKATVEPEVIKKDFEAGYAVHDGASVPIMPGDVQAQVAGSASAAQDPSAIELSPEAQPSTAVEPLTSEIAEDRCDTDDSKHMSRAVPIPSGDDACSQTVSLKALKEELIKLAVQPGSGWAVSVEDMHQVLIPRTFGLSDEGGETAREETSSLSWLTFFNTAMHLLNR